jgi:hypothetical protein
MNMKKKSISQSCLFSIFYIFICINLCSTDALALYVKNISKITDTPNDYKGAIEWSPSGNKLAFGYRGDIATINIDGSNFTLLTTGPRYDCAPRWSPDGSKIAFGSGNDRCNNYWLMNSDGSNQHLIYNFSEVAHANSEPVWTSDGTKLLFMLYEQNQGGDLVNVASVSIDGTGLTKLTNFSNPENAYIMSYCPANHKIAFLKSDAGMRWYVWIMNQDGTNKQQLTFSPKLYTSVQWSPDCSTLALEEWSDFPSPAYPFYKYLNFMNPDGSNYRLIYTFPNDSSTLSGWSPSGKYMVLYLNDNDLWFLRTDGTGLTRLSLDGYVLQAAFSPWSPISDDMIAIVLGTSSNTYDYYIVTLGNTPSGSNVTVTFPNGATATYSNVASACNSTFTDISNPSHNPPPHFKFVRYGYFDIATDCSYSGNITVTFPYNESEIKGEEQNLKLFHWKNNGWEDCTVSVDTVHNTITGRVTSLSDFGMGYYSSSGGGGGGGSGGGSGYSTGANENMIVLIAILAISAGVLLIRKRRMV